MKFYPIISSRINPSIGIGSTQGQRKTLVVGSNPTRATFLESPEKPFLKLLLAYSVNLVFSYVVKGIKMRITSKFRASKHLCFEDTKRIMSPEIGPKSFGSFEKQTPGQSFSPSLCGPNSYTGVDNWVKLHRSVRPWLPVVSYPTI